MLVSIHRLLTEQELTKMNKPISTGEGNRMNV